MADEDTSTAWVRTTGTVKAGDVVPILLDADGEPTCVGSTGSGDAMQEDVDAAASAAEAAQTSATAAATAAATAQSSATAAATAAATAQASADEAGIAAQAAIESYYRKYAAVTMTASEITTRCAHGHSESWARSADEGYWQGACLVGDVLIVYVTKPDASVGKLLCRVTAASAAGAATTAEVIQWDDNIRAYFWHDGDGAHIKGSRSSDTRTGRTDLYGDGMHVVTVSSSGTETDIAHFGYGQTQGESAAVDAPYYDIGVRKGSTIIGAHSVAEGYSTTSSGPCAHAEGFCAEAFGWHSHAEGEYTKAYELDSHAEGYKTEAYARYSHAEGYETYADGYASHAEGYKTTSSYGYTHAEGYGTVTNALAMHAAGKYNAYGSTAPLSTALRTTGNGTADDARSNAECLTSAGDLYLAGTVYTGCDDDSTGGKSIVDLIYPVGSIYMSVNSTSPATLFGGTWERIQDMFLLAAGDTYDAGDTGGAASVTLTAAQSGVPAHTHDISTSGGHTHDVSAKYTSGRNANTSSGGHAWWHADGTSTSTTMATIASNTGTHSHTANPNTADAASASHENMPPYLAVYIWKRTA